MDAQERPEKQAPLVTEAMEVLLRVIFQCWQLPLRNNHTDAHPICVDRFRGHVWWIGANGITYRPVFYAAVLLCLTDIDTGSVEFVVSSQFTTPVGRSPVTCSVRCLLNSPKWKPVSRSI